VTYIDEHKHLFGVEPICQALTSFGWPRSFKELLRPPTDSAVHPHAQTDAAADEARGSLHPRGCARAGRPGHCSRRPS
jgi:hypothetical protein